MFDVEELRDVGVPDVAEEACIRWRAAGEETEVVTWESLVKQFGLADCGASNICEAIIVRRTNSVECIIQDRPDWRGVCVGVNALTDRGWDVTVLAPLAALGTAHEGLRGTAARIQGWWTREAAMRFSPVEMA
ncbi:hypothetical protein [Diaminobutyricibacter sp. McL0608]|uniref:hypothetical protein n=1 Tax=Leifsonia sp. McL0608 TaxID=3143537 RepID=UPI0031F2DADA